MPNDTEKEVKLTDTVAPDLSASSADLTTPTSAPPRSEAEIPRTPAGPTPIEPKTPPSPTPAALPPTTHGFPMITVLLIITAIGAIAATYFFYQQTQTLSSQLSEVERTLERRRIEENQVTPTFTPSPTLEITPTATPPAGGSPTSIPVSPSPTIASNPHLLFSDVKTVIATAQKQYPNAQLLMIIATGVENPNTTIAKYWFRQTPTEKKYLYILRELGKNLVLVDQQVYVTPDNNIPSLNQLAANNGLGIDLAEALTIANAACPTNFDCTTTPISTQYIKANTTLWQISYKPNDGSKPFVVQIDSITKRILFKSM